MKSDHRRYTSQLFLVVVILGYSWLATGLRPFTVPIDVAVALPALTLFGFSWHQSRLGRVPSGCRPRPPWFALLAWTSLFAFLAAWELAAYVASPRQDHPTLSSISDSITAAHPARAVVFALWLGLGYKLFVRHVGREPRGA